LIVSFFFALAESALFSLGGWRLGRLKRENPRAAVLVERLLGKPHDLLATLVLGNAYANGLAVALVFWRLLEERQSLGRRGVVMSGLFILLALIGEVVPKTLGVRMPERWSPRVAAPMLWLVRVLQPLHGVAQGWVGFLIRRFWPAARVGAPGMSDEEVQELAEMAWQSGTLAEHEKELIVQIVRLDQRTAKDVMQPRSRMACIPDDWTLEEMVEAARRYGHRRLPMYDGTVDTIVGLLNTREFLLNPGADISEAIEFPSFVPESMNLLQLFRSLQKQRRGMAIVLDEYGGTVGLVTMGDIMESLVGETRGEGEEQGFLMERLGEGKWRVNGALRLDDFRREYGGLQDVPEVETLGGLVVHLSECVPGVGQAVQTQGLRLTVGVADERRVREVLVEVVGRKGVK